MILTWAVGIGAFILGMHFHRLLVRRERRTLIQALDALRLRVGHARWLIFRDWGMAADSLGQAEREAARALRISRDDVVPYVGLPDPNELDARLFMQRVEWGRAEMFV